MRYSNDLEVHQRGITFFEALGIKNNFVTLPRNKKKKNCYTTKKHIKIDFEALRVLTPCCIISAKKSSFIFQYLKTNINLKIKFL